MRIIDTSGVPAEDRESYAVRANVQAVRADDGVEIVDTEGKGQTINQSCVVIIDGDNYTPVPSDIFDALFAPAAALPAATTATPPAGTPGATEPSPADLTAQAQDAPGGVLSTDAGGQPHGEQPTVTPADTAATTEDTSNANTADTATEQATPSVTGLSQTDAAGNPVAVPGQ